MLDDKVGIAVNVDDVDAAKRAIEDICEKRKGGITEYLIEHSKKFDKWEKFAEYLGIYAAVLEE